MAFHTERRRTRLQPDFTRRPGLGRSEVPWPAIATAEDGLAVSTGHAGSKASRAEVRHRAGARIALLVGSLLVTFAVLEVALRVMGFDPFRDLKTGRQTIVQASTNPELGYELTPHAWGQAWGTEVLINAHGHRGPAGRPGPSDDFRIAVFGDSITFGNFLRADATYPAQLQRRLENHRPDYEVLNFGVGGYDILQNVAAIEARVAAFEPDVVVLGFCLNDAAVVSPNLEYIERTERYGSNPLYRSRVVALLAVQLDRIRMGSWQAHQNELDAFTARFGDRIDAIGDEETELLARMASATEREPSSWYRDAPRVGRLRHGLRRLAALSAERDFDVVIVIFPLLDGQDGRYDHAVAHDIIASEIRRAGLPEPIDLTAPYYAEHVSRLRINGYDVYHPNRAGHRIAAEHLAPRIEALRETSERARTP